MKTRFFMPRVSSNLKDMKYELIETAFMAASAEYICAIAALGDNVYELSSSVFFLANCL